jgi:hypothetical protein
MMVDDLSAADAHDNQLPPCHCVNSMVHVNLFCGLRRAWIVARNHSLHDIHVPNCNMSQLSCNMSHELSCLLVPNGCAGGSDVKQEAAVQISDDEIRKRLAVLLADSDLSVTTGELMQD